MENIYEISQYIGNDNIIQNELYSSISNIRNNLKNKYISPIKSAIKTESSKLKKEPSPEIRLIEAFKPFVSHTEHKKLNDMIDSIYKIKTLKNISKKFYKNIDNSDKNKLQIMSNSYPKNNDAIYEIDDNCIQNNIRPKISPLFILLALLE